jgi:hypothetical protein
MRHTLLAVALGALLFGCTKEQEAAQAPANQPTEPPSQTIAVGTVAPAISIENSHNWDGDLPTIEGLKGQVVVLDYWAYW